MDKEIIEKYMKVAIEEAMIAKKEGENPFGAVLIDSNNILLDEGLKVFDDFEFTPQDERKNNM